MNLKKSDKMIAGIAVVVLIIAAIGIIYYSESEDEVPDNGDDKDKMILFNVIDDVKDGCVVPEDTNYKVKDKLLNLGGDGGYHGEVDIAQQNLKSVQFKFDYTDTKSGKILKSLGRDTLTVKISDSNGEVIDKQTITGSGNKTIEVNSITPMISLAQIEAETEAEAEERLEERYSDFPMNTTFKIDVTLKIGEIRLLKRIVEKLFGNDAFELEITYDYYHYGVEEVEEDDEDKKTNLNEQVIKPTANIYASTALGGKL